MHVEKFTDSKSGILFDLRRKNNEVIAITMQALVNNWPSRIDARRQYYIILVILLLVGQSQSSPKRKS